MSVLHPLLLAAGIGAVAIPIIIHLLLRRRRRPIRWAAMRFLLEAYQKQRRKLKLQQWLLLAARCLLVALIGVALARPLFDRGLLSASERGRTVYLVVDNSIASTLSESGAGPALDRFKTKAGEVIAGMGPSDRAALISMASPAEAIVLPASADGSAVRRLVESLESTDSAPDLSRALELVGQSQRDDPDRESVVVVLSDLLEGAAEVSAPLPSMLAGWENAMVVAPAPRSSAPGNVQVISATPLWDDPSDLRPGQLSVHLRRTGAAVSERSTVTVRVREDRGDAAGGRSVLAAQPIAERAVRFAPGQAEARETLPLDRDRLESTGEERTLLVAEIDGDAIAADNVRRTVVALRDSIRVGIVAQRRFGTRRVEDMRPADWYRNALTPQASTPMEIVDINPAVIDVPQLATLDAVIVAEAHLVQDQGWSALRSFVDRGGFLLLSPPADVNVHLWTESFEQAFDAPVQLAREAREMEAPLRVVAGSGPSALFRILEGELDDLLRPILVQRVLSAEPVAGGPQAVLSLADGAPWLMVIRAGESASNVERGGLVVYLATPPDPRWTNLPLMPFMVPLVQEVVRQGVAMGRAAVSDVVAGQAFSPLAGVAELVSPREGGEARREVVREDGSVVVHHAGVWRGRNESGRGEAMIAANAEVDGARTGVVDQEAVRGWLAGAFGSGADPAKVVRWLDDEAGEAATSSTPTGSPFDTPLLLAVLALAAIEMGLARWASHAGPWRRAIAARPPTETAA